MDHQIFLAINSLAGKWHLLDVLGRFLGSDYFLYVFALVVALLWFKKHLRPKVYLAFISAFVGRALFTEILKHVVGRPRPFEVLRVHQLIIDNERGVSFPSGHATIYFALAFAFWGTEYFWPFLVAAVIGSIARIFVGVHYPSDILGGAVIGFLTVWLIRRLFKKRFI